MKNSLTLLIFILTMISEICFAQQTSDKFNIVEFKIFPGRRSRYSEVTIRLTKNIPRRVEGEYVVNVKLDPMNIDTLFAIDKKVFDDLANEVIQVLNKIDFSKSLKGPGFDGNSCTIEYGTYTEKVAYKIWSPDFKTEERGLNGYLNLCKKIIQIGGLYPVEIMY